MAGRQGIEPCFEDLEASSRPALRPVVQRVGVEPNTDGLKVQLPSESYAANRDSVGIEPGPKHARLKA